LLPTLFPQVTAWAESKQHALTVVPNLNDLRSTPRDETVISPRQDIWTVVQRIAQSDMVVGSSLHAIIVAESLGIPARPVVSERESSFKYRDYYLGTGRDPRHVLAASVQDAISRGGAPPLQWSPDALLAAFPRDLWEDSCPGSDRPATGLITAPPVDPDLPGTAVANRQGTDQSWTCGPNRRSQRGDRAG
jgi:pyruvyltransferase